MNSLVVPPPPRGLKQRVVVIGGGVTGTLSAWELARAGHQVTLLEARALGNGASSRSAACIRQQFTTPSTVRGMRYCVKFYENWHQLIGGNQLPLEQNGYLFLYDLRTDPDTLRQRVTMQRRVGLAEVEFLSRDELAERFQYIETTGLVGATWCPTDGFLHPDLVYHGAAKAAEDLGARIVCGAEVVSADTRSNRLIRVTTEKGETFEGDIFINATNIWAPAMSRMCGGSHLPVTAWRRYLYFLPGMGDKDEFGLNAGNTHTLPMIITPRDCYCRPEGHARLMIGWAHITVPEIPTFENQDTIEPGFGCTDYQGLGGAIRKELEAYIPAITEMRKVTAVSTGFYDVSPDHNPIIGFDPKIENLLHATGFSGHGLMHAPFTGLIVANLVAARRDLTRLDLPLGLGEVDLKTFAIKREFRESEAMVL